MRIDRHLHMIKNILEALRFGRQFALPIKHTNRGFTCSAREISIMSRTAGTRTLIRLIKVQSASKTFCSLEPDFRAAMSAGQVASIVLKKFSSVLCRVHHLARAGSNNSAQMRSHLAQDEEVVRDHPSDKQ